MESYRDLCTVHKVKCVSACEWKLKNKLTFLWDVIMEKLIKTPIVDTQ